MAGKTAPPGRQEQPLPEALNQLLFMVSFSFNFPFLRLHCIIYVFERLQLRRAVTLPRGFGRKVCAAQ